MKTVLVLLAFFLLAGCSSIPSMKYCQKVEYVRDGSKVTIHAECYAPVGSIPGL